MTSAAAFVFATSAAASDPAAEVRGPAAPEAPVITSSDPSGPSTDPSVRLFGQAPANTRVEIYTQAGCAGEVEGFGRARRFAEEGISVNAYDYGVNTYSARAVSDEGVASACSSAFTYERLPSAPSIYRSDPDSPSTNPAPRLFGHASFGSTVELFAADDCSGEPVGEGTAPEFENAGIQVDPISASTSFTARIELDGVRSGCSDPFAYDLAPSQVPTPTFSRTDPASPGQSLRPRLYGTAAPGSTVRIYSELGCASGPDWAIAEVSAEEFESTGVEVNVDPGSTRNFTADATIAGLERSACSEPISYEHDPPVPAAPTITSSSPSDPSPDDFIALFGETEEGTEVELFAGGGCAGDALYTSSAADSDGLFSGHVEAPVVGENPYSARAVNADDEESPCSETYTHVRVPPHAPPVFDRTIPDSPNRARSARFFGTAPEGTTVELHDDAACTGLPIATAPAETFETEGIPLRVAPNSNVELWARAVSPNNESACSPDSIIYRNDRLPPSVRIFSAPREVERGERVTIRFGSSSATRFLCRIGDGEARPCSSPVTFRASPSRDRLQIRAVDAAGNIGRPAVVRFKVVGR
ncbi:hypothetical protein HJD18_12375 [Thermoleophilia bacterium SCSIO 60948]|nr:hypothetical protein HJD18_12375 [Thermoleophilia bacterium SCSIO 60948]